MFYQIDLLMDETETGDFTWLVTAPAFPEVTTFGASTEEALRNGLHAIEEAMAGRISLGETFEPPISKTPRKGHFVEPSLLTVMKIFLYHVCKDKDISRAELVRRLGWHREQVDRLFRLDHKSQVDQLEAAFEAVGTPIKRMIDFNAAA